MTHQVAEVVHEIVTELKGLSDEKVVEVLDFVRFLNTRSSGSSFKHAPRRVLDEAQLVRLYAECAEEDRQLAEMGMADYAAALKSEDANAKG